MFGRSIHAFDQVVEHSTPWLIDFGGWIFGGLIGLILLIVPALITVGPVDAPIMIATVALALALPLNVAGLIVLKLVQDMDRIGLSRELTRAFQDAGLPAGQFTPAAVASGPHRPSGTQMALYYSLGALQLSVLLVLTGLVAALWHMAWWIAVAFLAMVVLCLSTIIVALAKSRPPDTPEVKERQRRYWDDLVSQAQARAQAQQAFPKKEGGQ
ncbi:MAG TPA: hypothetical protein VIC85_18425 [Ktedonobacterales bacterium]|jgi:hypothetical protein